MDLSKPKFLNWIKAALAVLFTKEEIEPVVYNEIAQFQQKCLQNISSLNGVQAGSICSNCTTENVVNCPTKRICNVSQGECSYHRGVTTQYRPSICPYNICNQIKSEIQKAHRFSCPSYKNTDATQWCRNPWEIAKCFMPPDGYKDVMNAADTDFNGIINVMLNYIGFEGIINDDLSKGNNIFVEGKNVGRDIRHSSNLEVEDAELIHVFSTLKSILTDQGFIRINKSPNNASQKLAKLQTDDLIIGKDVVRKVLDDVGKEIQKKIRNEMNEYEMKTEKRKLELIDIVNLKVQDIEKKGNVSLTQLNDALKLSVDAVDAKKHEAIEEIKAEKGNAITDIHKAAEKAKGSATMSNEAYQKRKKDAVEALERMTQENDLATNVKAVAAILVLEGDDIDSRFHETFNKTIITLLRGIRNRKGASPDQNEDFFYKFDELISHIEQITGAEANDGEPACVIVKFICRTNEDIKKLLEYFDSDDLKYRLKEIANLISCRTKTQVNLSFRISDESLDSILQAEVAGGTSSSETMNNQKHQKSFKETYYLGTILDVSCPKQSFSDTEGGKWVSALLDVIDNLATHDVSSSNKVLAIGAGARRMEYEAFDVIKTIALVQNGDGCDSNLPEASNETITAIFDFLEKHGAKHIRKWAKNNVVSSAVTEDEARLVLRMLKEDRDFTETFVFEYLPKYCLDWVDENDTSVMGFFRYHFQRVHSSVVSSCRQATSEDVSYVVQKAVSYLLRVRDDSVYAVHEAADIIRGTHRGQRLSPERAKELHRKMKPYIYGSTPLYSALHRAADLFPTIEVGGKYLFVFSDGQPSDYGSVKKLKSKLEKKSIYVIGCYMSTSAGCNIKPQKLYGTVGSDWEPGARFLFDISSTILTDNVSQAIFIKNGWDIDINNVETRLFLHINNPENMRIAVETVKKAIKGSQDIEDSLLDLIAYGSIGMYINKRNDQFEVPIQKGYANAAATVMHLAMVRKCNREDGCPEFETLRKEIIDEFGNKGADTMTILERFCPKYRLHCKVIDSKKALKAVSEGRPVIAGFALTENEWRVFNTIFMREPKKILSEKDIHISRSSADMISHSVVLTSYNSDSLCLMNSQGVTWGDEGFFRIKNADVLGLDFIDVYWTENDLSKQEKLQYRKHGIYIARTFVDSLKGIMNGIYQCPLCEETSNISEFRGTLSTVVCPECNGKIDTNDGKGNSIAMNIYLTSFNN